MPQPQDRCRSGHGDEMGKKVLMMQCHDRRVWRARWVTSLFSFKSVHVGSVGRQHPQVLSVRPAFWTIGPFRRRVLRQKCLRADERDFIEKGRAGHYSVPVSVYSTAKPNTFSGGS